METGHVSSRFHALDSLRAIAMLLGVFFHATLSFLENPGIWSIRDRSYHPLVGLLVWASHGFRMQLFFLIAGFFACLLYRRYGFAGFVRHRLLRIVLPFAAGVVFLVPVIHAVWIYGAMKAGTLKLDLPLWQAIVGYFVTGMYFTRMTPAHLWFLYYLIFMYAAALAVLGIYRRLRQKQENAPPPRLLYWLIRTPWKPLLLAVPTMLILSRMQLWAVVDEPGFSFVPNVYTLLYYGQFFVFGWWLHHYPEQLPTFTRPAWWYCAGAVVIVGVIAFLMSQGPDAPYRYPQFVAYGALFLSALYPWLMVFAFLGIAVGYFSTQNPTVRYLSDAAYWIYLMHLPLVVYLQVLLADHTIFGPVKYLLINGIALALLLLSYHYGVRYTFIGAILNGKRERPQARVAVLAYDLGKDAPG